MHRKKGRQHQPLRTLLQALDAFIPQRVGSKAVLTFFELLRMLHRRHGRSLPEPDSRALYAHRAELRGGYVENQLDYADVPYGAVTMSYAGCEIFAAANALRDLTGTAPPLAPLISSFSRDGMVFRGRFGTSPAAIADYFNALGCRAELTSTPERFDAVAAESDSVIVSFFNNRSSILAGVHTVALTRTPTGWIAHNVHCRGSAEGPFQSVAEMLSAICGGRARAICLIGIRKETKA